MITITAGALAFIGSKGFIIDSMPIAIFIVILGVYGLIFSAKLYERWDFHIVRARYWHNRIIELHPDIQLLELKRKADNEHKLNFPKLNKFHLFRLWLGLHIVIILMGISCIIIILV